MLAALLLLNTVVKPEGREVLPFGPKNHSKVGEGVLPAPDARRPLISTEHTKLKDCVQSLGTEELIVTSPMSTIVYYSISILLYRNSE